MSHSGVSELQMQSIKPAHSGSKGDNSNVVFLLFTFLYSVKRKVPKIQKSQMPEETNFLRSQEASISTPWMIPLENIIVHSQNKTSRASRDLKIDMQLHFGIWNPFLVSKHPRLLSGTL